MSTTISQGSTATLTLAQGDFVALQNSASSKARLEITSGTNKNKIIAEAHKGNQTYGPFDATTVSVSAIIGSLKFDFGANPLVSDGGTPGLTIAQAAALVGSVAYRHGLALLGDSYQGNGFQYVGTVRWAETSQSMYQALNSVLGGPWDLVCDATYTGTTSANWINGSATITSSATWIVGGLPLAAVVASSASTVWVGFPENDITLDLNAAGSIATSMANMTAIFDAIRASGKSIICTTAGSLAAWTGAKFAQAKALSDWIVGQANLNGWPVFDVLNGVYDPATGKGSTTLMLSEGAIYSHPSGQGHIATARRSLPNFARIQGRPVHSMNGPTQGLYNTAMTGDTSGLPDGWAAYSNASPTGTSTTKVARTDGVGSLVRFTGVGAAASNCRYGMQTAAISWTGAWSAAAKTLGQRCKGSFGDHWVCTTAGTSSGSEPAAMAAASNIGDTVTDSGGVVWTRYKNIVPGSSLLTVRLDFDITDVSGGDLSCQPTVLVNFSGSSLPYAGMRANALGTATDPHQQWGWTKQRRPVTSTPYQVPVPSQATGATTFVYMQWGSAGGQTATMDVYGLEYRID